ncbi:hypothetical protein CBR_g41142 [Chara braunii]|uniref:Cyclin-L1-1 n=1 Tax=Chara braunii TaxID=69332 RepID=A0A388LV96_CHABU|nr:hypothetical protein CBR_g41142 [Chara braunii]|eukprot:GBG86238.1 hypothetical protein CBR_g41142 [Chara braunii]
MIYTTIDTFYLTDEQLANSPSRKNGVDQRTETMLRIYGCELIQEAGILLKLPQAVMATAQVIFQRFYCKKSFTVYNVKRTAASCVWLAAKLEESQRKIRDVLNVFNRMEQRRENLPLEPLDPLSKKYEELKLDLIRTERHILKEMGFICHVEHPHKFILYYLNSLGASSELMQQVWNLANDSLRTTLCVRFKGEVVACGVIYAAARRARVPLPENPQWWLVFNAKKEDIDVVCRELALLYSYPRAEYIEVCKDQKSFVLSTRAWNPPAPVQELNARRQQANGTTSSSVMQANGAQGNSFRGMDVGNSVQPAPVSTIRESAVPSMPVATANGHNTVKGEFVKGESGKGLVDSRKELSEREGERHRERGREREKEKERSKEREREWERDRDREHVRDREREREHRERQRPRDERARGRPEKAREVIPSREHSSYGAFREKRNHRHHPYDKTNLKAAAS